MREKTNPENLNVDKIQKKLDKIQKRITQIEEQFNNVVVPDNEKAQVNQELEELDKQLAKEQNNHEEIQFYKSEIKNLQQDITKGRIFASDISFVRHFKEEMNDIINGDLGEGMYKSFQFKVQEIRSKNFQITESDVMNFFINQGNSIPDINSLYEVFIRVYPFKNSKEKQKAKKILNSLTRVKDEKKLIAKNIDSDSIINDIQKFRNKGSKILIKGFYGDEDIMCEFQKDKFILNVGKEQEMFNYNAKGGIELDEFVGYQKGRNKEFIKKIYLKHYTILI